MFLRYSNHGARNILAHLKNLPILCFSGIVTNFIATGCVVSGLNQGVMYLNRLPRSPFDVTWIEICGYCLAAFNVILTLLSFLVCTYTSANNSTACWATMKKLNRARWFLVASMITTVATMMVWMILASLLSYPLFLIGLLKWRYITLGNNTTTDFSYYGVELNVTDYVSLTNQSQSDVSVLIYSSTAFIGALLYFLGFFQVALSSALNYARLATVQNYESKEYYANYSNRTTHYESVEDVMNMSVIREM